MQRWTEDEEIYLEYYLYDEESKNYDDAAEFLGKSHRKITKKAYKMRKKDKNIQCIQKDYQDWEIEYLKKAYFMTTTDVMSERLGRSRESIIAKANQLGITKLQKVREYDKEIRALASEGYTRAEIARKLKLKPKSVGDYINRNNIDCQYATREVMGKAFREDETKRFSSFKNKYYDDNRYFIPKD